jgi:hypothetical protein
MDSGKQNKKSLANDFEPNEIYTITIDEIVIETVNDD